GFADVVVGAAFQGHVKIFNGTNGALLFSQFILPGTVGPISVAAGDVNGDGFADITVGAGPGVTATQVTVLDGKTGTVRGALTAFPGFTGGVVVGAVDRNGDGLDDIVVGAGIGAPGGHVKVFSGQTLALIDSFFAFNFPTGLSVGGVGR